MHDPQHGKNRIGRAVAIALALAIAAVAAAGACRCSLAYGEPFWLYNRETGYFCGADCTSGGGIRPCPMRCGPTLSRPTPLILDAPPDYAGVLVTSPSLRCALRAENATRGAVDRVCVPRPGGPVVCGVGDPERWLVVVGNEDEGVIRDGDTVMLLAVPEPSHVGHAPLFSWCHADSRGDLSCDATQGPARGLFVVWRAP